MATKREKGVTLNSRGVYEIRLAGKYRGCRKSLAEANSLSIEYQKILAKEEKKQYIATGKTGKKASAPKKQSTVTGRKNKTASVVKSENIIPPPKPAAAEMVMRIEKMPEKKESFWSKLKKAIFKN